MASCDVHRQVYIGHIYSTDFTSRCFLGSCTLRLQSLRIELMLRCCPLMTAALSPSVTECLRLFGLSSSRISHSGCPLTPSFTPPSGKTSSGTFSPRHPGPDGFLAFFPASSCSERMLEDWRCYSDEMHCRVAMEDYFIYLLMNTLSERINTSGNNTEIC